METPEIKTGLCLDWETLRDILSKQDEYDDDAAKVCSLSLLMTIGMLMTLVILVMMKVMLMLMMALVESSLSLVH